MIASFCPISSVSNSDSPSPMCAITVTIAICSQRIGFESRPFDNPIQTVAAVHISKASL